jgi:hypothetical protein
MKEIRLGNIGGMILAEESQLLGRKAVPVSLYTTNATWNSSEQLATNQLSYAMAYWDIYIFQVYMHFTTETTCMNTRRAQSQLTATSGMFRLKPVNTIHVCKSATHACKSATHVVSNSSHTSYYSEKFL